MLNRLLPIVFLWLLIDIYFFQAVHTATMPLDSTLAYVIYATYWLFEATLISFILFIAFTGKLRAGNAKNIHWAMGLMILSVVPKLIASPLLLLEDACRLTSAFINLFVNEGHRLFTGRRNVISLIVLGIASVPFFSIIYGMIKGKYDYTVRKVELTFKNLPKAFDGFKITQLSDIHAGSFDNEKAVEKGIALVNKQKSDVILFTGDMVNNQASELDRWIGTFSKLSAPMGKYSVLGNHDYGDYIHWENKTDKNNNLLRLKEIQKEIGFRLLLNEHVKIEKDGHSISLIGVENWGNRGFHQYGDLNKALVNVEDDSFKILLSHDPSHWEAETLPHPKSIQLTLSGHTHGMQFGIELPWFKWSIIKYIYPQWAGLYEKSEKYLYVNRGFGFLAFPGRVGIKPEITVITLKKG